MTGLYKAFLATTAIAIAMPVAAQSPGPATTTFDGFYAGVSREASRIKTVGKTNCPVPDGVPAPLTIAAGMVRSTTTSPGWEGTVSPQGVVVVRGQNSFRIDAQIDPQGTIRGNGSSGICNYQYVWQKRSR